MFQDILRDSPIYQEIVEQGREEGRIQEQQEMLMRLVQFLLNINRGETKH